MEESNEKKKWKNGGERTQGHRCVDAERREGNNGLYLGFLGIFDDVGVGFEDGVCGG